MTTIFFGALRSGPEPGGARPVAPVLCSVIVICHLGHRRRRDD